MDVDSNDGTVTEALNGETKPDVVKLAQSAIIKQVLTFFPFTNVIILRSKSSFIISPH